MLFDIILEFVFFIIYIKYYFPQYNIISLPALKLNILQVELFKKIEDTPKIYIVVYDNMYKEFYVK